MSPSSARRCGNKTAQGNALGSRRTPRRPSPEGCNKTARRLVVPFQGIKQVVRRTPRALPWAILFGPCGTIGRYEIAMIRLIVVLIVGFVVMMLPLTAGVLTQSKGNLTLIVRFDADTQTLALSDLLTIELLAEGSHAVASRTVQGLAAAGVDADRAGRTGA